MEEGFTILSYQHIYNDLNSLPDSLPKDGIHLNSGSWVVMKIKDGIPQPELPLSIFDDG